MSNMGYKETIAMNIRRLLEERGKSQIDLTKDLGINKASVSDWVNGRSVPREEYIDLLCAYFGILRDDLLTEHRSDTLTLSEGEKRLVQAYRGAPENIQRSIRVMLNVEE